MAFPIGRDPTAMRNLPLVAFRLTHAQRTECQAEADRRGVSLNALARDALLATIPRQQAHVNAPKKPGRIGARAPHVEYDEG